MAVKLKDDRSLKQIICPHCGSEYKAYDIFIPQSLLGKGSYVRDSKGKIIEEYENNKAYNSELYECDVCLKSFIVTVDMKFTTKPFDNSYQFQEDIKLNLSE